MKPSSKKVVGIGGQTEPSLDSAANAFSVYDSSFGSLKKWLAVLLSLIFVLALVSFIFSKNSHQQVQAPADDSIRLSDTFKAEIKQQVAPVEQAEFSTMTEKERDEAHDIMLSSDFVGPVLDVSDKLPLEEVLPEESVFDEDEVAASPLSVDQRDELQPWPSRRGSNGIDDSPVTDQQSAAVRQAQLTVAKMEQTDALKKNKEVIIDIGAERWDSHNIVDIDPPSKKNLQHTTNKENKPIKVDVSKQSKPAAEIQEETEKIKTPTSQEKTLPMTSQSISPPRKTNSPSVSSEVQLAKQSDPEFVIIKRAIDRGSLIAEPIEEIPVVGVTAAPTNEDLNKLVIFFTSSYEAGEIDAFSDLFVEKAVSNGSFNREQIRDDYENLFKSTGKRRIDIKDLIWSMNGSDALGIGTFKVFISNENGNEVQQFHGEIVIEAQKQQRRTQIKKLFYRYNVASNDEG